MRSRADILEIFSSVQGEGALVGERQLFVRFYGCNRACDYCDTLASKSPVSDCRVEKAPGLGDFLARPNPVSAHEFIQAVGSLNVPKNLHHSLSLTGGEPLLHVAFLAEILPMLATEIPVMLETNGILHEELGRILDWLKWISMDVKIPSATGEPAEWEAHRLFLNAARDKNTWVKAVIDPSVQDAEIEMLTRLIEDTDPAIPLILQPVHGTEGDPAWSRRLLELQAHCKAHIKSVRVLPQMHKILNVF